MLGIGFIAMAQSTALSDSFKHYQYPIDTLLTDDKVAEAEHLHKTMLSSGIVRDNVYEQYFLRTRKMEFNYYYDLGKLGLVDAKRNLKWALENGTDMMVMDAYNFLGLFNFILNNYQESIEAYKKGVQAYHHSKDKTTPYELSTLFHLQNNLAESYCLLGEYDSAFVHCQQAYDGALSKKNERMQALSLYQMAKIFTGRGQHLMSDSLLVVAKNLAAENNFWDVYLICTGSLALSKHTPDNQSKQLLKEGFELLKTKTNINSLYTKNFLSQALAYYNRNNSYQQQSWILKQLTEIEKKKKEKEVNYLTSQYEEIISENEKRIALEKLSLQKSKDMQKMILVTAGIGFLALAAIFSIFFLRVKRKNAILEVRSSISRDLHDDLGSSLSSLNIYSDILSKSLQLPDDKKLKIIDNIHQVTKDLLNNLHDIIWSLERRQQTSLDDMLKSYAMNMLTNKGIKISMRIHREVEQVLTSPKARKNILMVLKEIMNNCSKYSQAQSFKLEMVISNSYLNINTEDDGKGFDTNTTYTGNGLKNMKKRVNELFGHLEVISDMGSGTKFHIQIPVKHIRMKEYFFKPIHIQKETKSA